MPLIRTVSRGAFLVAALVLCVAGGHLPAEAANPRLIWKTISTEHFDVHFHEGAEWTGEQVAAIAEEIYPHITGLYEYEPKRCHFVILDTEDYANGAAYYYDNKIEIWATNLEFNLRGTSDWLRNVVTHEFTHIVSIQAAMKMPLRIPAIYLQGVSFESEKRPDVINGYPDLIVSYPVTGTVIPAWWAEGVAQYQAPSRQYDCWDPHRDMILRAAVIEDRMLTYDEMGFLGHRSLGNEQVYDHGYGLVRYIAETYGAQAMDAVSEKLGKPNRLTIDGALEAVTGKNGDALYADWRQSMRERYDRMLAPVRADPREGAVVNADGFMTLAPSWSPDGRRVAFLSNKGSDFSATALYVSDPEGQKVERLRNGVSSRAVFSADGSRLLYARHVRADAYGSMLSDIHVYDFATKKEKRLTEKRRLADPQWSPDGRTIVCVQNGDGTHRLATVPVAGGDPVVIYDGGKGVQLYSPQYSPDGRRILFGIFKGGTRDIASVDAGGGDFRFELKTGSDERDARWTPDGTGFVFSSERSGIFNLFRMDLADSAVTQLSNVAGGAVMPDMAPDGAVVYAQYSGKGYHVARLDAGTAPVATFDIVGYATRAAGEFDDCSALRAEMAERPASAIGVQMATLGATAQSSSEIASDASFAEGTGPVSYSAADATPYDWDYTGFQFYPRFVLWDGTPRLGMFVATNEILDRQSLFFGGSYGVDGEFDLLVDFELRRLFPVIYMSYYKVRQKYDDEFPIEDLDRYYFIDYRYDVWSGDIGLRFEFDDRYSLTRRHELSVWWNHSEYNVFLEPEYVPIGDPDAERQAEQPVGWKYYVANEAHARWYFKSITRSIDSDINPRGGREITAEAMYGMDDLFVTGEFDYGVNPKYTRFDFGQYTVDWREYIALPAWRHTLQVRLMASFIDADVDDFFWVYMGGMDRLRGYTYYAIGGRKGALASLTYRFPILRRINTQASWLTFKDLYGAVFYEAANAWGSDTPGDAYTSAGVELRLAMGSFYSYPTTVNFTAAYALDDAVYRNPIAAVPPVFYDPQWRYYLLVAFTF